MSHWRTRLMDSRPRGLDDYNDTLKNFQTFVGTVGRIEQLAIAPIKALGQLPLRSALVTRQGLCSPDGLFADRSAMIGRAVHNKPWKFERVSQRDVPRLALVTAVLCEGTLAYYGPRVRPLLLQEKDLQPQPGYTVPVRMTADDDVHELVMDNGPMTTWIREFCTQNSNEDWDPATLHVLCRPRNWMRFVEDRHRCKTEAETTLTDGGQLLIASSSTLAWMNECMRSEHEMCEPIRMNAFRPNIVIGGLPPNAEDVIDHATVDGTHTMRFGGLCVRCSVTQVDQVVGEKRADKQPLAWLGKHRPARPPENMGATFGVHCVLDAPSEPWTLRTGADICIVQEK